jgi:hypothetical protein
MGGLGQEVKHGIPAGFPRNSDLRGAKFSRASELPAIESDSRLFSQGLGIWNKLFSSDPSRSLTAASATGKSSVDASIGEA